MVMPPVSALPGSRPHTHVFPPFPSPKDKDAGYDNTTWCNRDLIPIPADRRTYGIWSYVGMRSLSLARVAPSWPPGPPLTPRQVIGQ